MEVTFASGPKKEQSSFILNLKAGHIVKSGARSGVVSTKTPLGLTYLLADAQSSEQGRGCPRSGLLLGPGMGVFAGGARSPDMDE